jgi:hypothetical protein
MASAWSTYRAAKDKMKVTVETELAAKEGRLRSRFPLLPPLPSFRSVEDLSPKLNKTERKGGGSKNGALCTNTLQRSKLTARSLFLLSPVRRPPPLSLQKGESHRSVPVFPGSAKPGSAQLWTASVTRSGRLQALSL